MRICVVGAGAIGGLLACRLSLSGNEVSVIARGEHLAAIRSGGLRLNEIDGSVSVADELIATDDFEALDSQDVVVLALKAHQIAAVAERLCCLYDRETVVVPVQNGIPWWYFERHGGEHEGRRLSRLDPDGLLAEAIPAERLVASIPYPAAEKPAPGVITHIEGDRFPVGELDGSRSERSAWIASAFSEAGFKSRVLNDIRSHIWVKAWGNLAFNPISALTGGTLRELCETPATRELAARMMEEAREIAEALGVSIRLGIEQRIAGAREVGDHKTSMLQDVEAGRALEIDPIVGVFLDLAEITGVNAPVISAVYALTSFLNERLLAA